MVRSVIQDLASYITPFSFQLLFCRTGYCSGRLGGKFLPSQAEAGRGRWRETETERDISETEC